MSLISAHELLTTINILDPLEKESIQKRHPKNEFQAYAFRLANDLNDLQNLHIYMRLSKNIDRSLMERAYSFVSDSTSNDKGRLFLWKLKQIRTDLQKKRDLINFDYEFIVAKMSKIRDSLIDLICEKSESEYSIAHINSFHTIYEEIVSNVNYSKREKPTILILGYCSPRLLIDLEMCGYKVRGVELSKKLNLRIKTTIKELNLKSKWITKDFLKNSFEDNCFDVIFLNNYWSLIPKDSEITFLKSLRKVLKNNGKLVINYKISKEDKQEWKNIKYKGEELLYFTKECTEESFRESLRVLFEDIVFL